MNLRCLLFLSAASILSGCISTSNNVEKDNSVKVKSVSYPGRLWGQPQADAKIVCHDGGASFKVPGGALWSFGDTFLGQRKPDDTADFFPGEAISCSIAFLKDSDKGYPPKLKYLTGPSGKAISPFSYLKSEDLEKTRIWPGNGIYINGKYYLYYEVIRITGNTEWSFEGAGAGLAVSDKALGAYDRIVHNGSTLFPVRANEIIPENEWLYIFDIRNIKGWEQGVFMSRVSAKDIENPEMYEFYAGDNKYSKNIKDSVPVLRDVYGQISIAWDDYLGKYLMATSSSFFHPRRILFYTAEKITGPWKEAFEIQTPDKFMGKDLELVYCSYLHPELFKNDGKTIFLTFFPKLKNVGFDCNCETLEIELEKELPTTVSR